MRILHTSDWHLGARFHDQDRTADEEFALTQVIECARRHAVDAVLIAGDVFDTANPGAAEQGRFYRSMFRLIRDAGVPSIVVIAGNHDNGLRLQGPRQLLDELHLHIRGLFPHDAQPTDLLIELQDRSGAPGAWCAAVPYLRDGDLRRIVLGEASGDSALRQADALAKRYTVIAHALAAVAGGLPQIVMAHCFAVGASRGGHERQVMAEVGNLGRADITSLASGADYAAFGHLHRGQPVAGKDHWRYCGSLLPNGFDEIHAERGMVIADLTTAGQPAAITVVPFTPFRSYRQVSGTRDEVLAAITGLPHPATGESTPWLMATVDSDRPLPGLPRELSDAADARGWRLLRTTMRSAAPQGQQQAMTTENLADMTPESVFHRAFSVKHPGAEPSGDLLDEFRRLLGEVGGA